jgi:hypothetical protein
MHQNFRSLIDNDYQDGEQKIFINLHGVAGSSLTRAFHGA